MQLQRGKKEYLVQVQITEIRQIAGKEGGTADPFIKITVGNLPTQVTQTKEKTTTAVFNQNFTFTGLKLNDIDFENYEIKIEVYNQNSFFQNDLIGTVSIGISTLYRNPNHEYFNKWLTLLHPKEGLKPQGYLLTSVYIVGEGDQPPVHEVGENKIEDEPDEFGNLPDDQLAPDQLLKRRERQKQIGFVLPPKVINRSYQLMVSIIKAEDLVIMNGKTCDAFVSVRVNGITQRTKAFSNQTKPQYKTRMLFPVNFPISNDKIVIRIWDQRVCLSDTFIGQIPEIPTENDWFSLSFLQSRGGILPYTWFNIYGIPMSERPSDFENKYLGYKKMEYGTSFMGRILLSLNLTPSEKPESRVEAQSIYREPSIEKYSIRFDCYEVSEVQDCGKSVTIRMCVGGANVTSYPGLPLVYKIKQGQKKNEQQQEIQQKLSYIWKDNNVMCPVNQFDLVSDQIQHPDIIIELYNEFQERQAYLRVPADHPDLIENKPKWYEFKAVKYKNQGLDNMGGDPIFCFVLMNMMLGVDKVLSELPRIPIKRNVTSPHMVTVRLYAGYSLSPYLYSESIDALCQLRFGEFKHKFKIISSCRNPIWNQKIQFQLQLDENLEFCSNLIFQLTNEHPSQRSGLFSSNKLGDAVIQAFNVGSEDDFQEGDFQENEDQQKNWKFYPLKLNGELTGGHSSGRCNNKSMGSISDIDSPIWNQIAAIKNEGIDEKLIQKKTLNQQCCVNLRISLPQLNKEKCYTEVVAKSVLPGGEQETQHNPGQEDPNFYQIYEIDYLQPKDVILTPQLELEIRSGANQGQQFIIEIPLIKYLKQFDKTQKQQALNQFTGQDIPTQSQENIQQKVSIPEEKQNKTIQIDDNLQNLLWSSVISNKIQSSLKGKGILNVAVEDHLSLLISQQDKQDDTNIQDYQVQQLKILLKSLPKNTAGSENAQNLIKKELLRLNEGRKIEEGQFLGLNIGDDQEETFDYGRTVYRGPYEDIINKSLPYQQFPIMHLQRYKRSTLAILKMDLKVFIKKLSVTDSKKQSHLAKFSLNSYKFDIFDPDFIRYFIKGSFQVKLRVYIYRGLSLAAQQEDIELRQKLAGQDAVCAANPYIEVQCGDGITGELIKFISDSNRYIENDLSPIFLRMYELDAILPQDWCLTVRVMSKGLAMNSMIGFIKIDLENRLLGEPKIQQQLSYLIYRQINTNELEKLKYVSTDKADQQKKKLQSQINNINQLIEQFDTSLKIPVEYKSLQSQENSKTTQGTIEMVVEVLPLDIARLIQPQQLIEPPLVDYEVRLIVLETFNIAKPTDKNLINIMVEARMDALATGTGLEEVNETDVHNGSEDGWGIFNWRMKFHFRTPCQFPRIKVSVYDFSAFGTNENIGQATLSLKRVLSSLRSEGKYLMPPTQIKITNPQFPDQDRGSVLLQLSIVEKAVAENQPVGNAREEPNVDPFLSTPKEGRGLGDFLKGFSFFPWRLILNQILKILIPMVISALIGFICFVKPGIMLPKQ